MLRLGGLPKNTTVEELIRALGERGYSVRNRPHLGEGYARDVQLGDEHQVAFIFVSGKKKALAAFFLDVM